MSNKEKTWSCAACTYANKPIFLCCEICGKQRPHVKSAAATLKDKRQNISKSGTAASKTNRTLPCAQFALILTHRSAEFTSFFLQNQFWCYQHPKHTKDTMSERVGCFKFCTYFWSIYVQLYRTNAKQDTLPETPARQTKRWLLFYNYHKLSFKSFWFCSSINEGQTVTRKRMRPSESLAVYFGGQDIPRYPSHFHLDWGARKVCTPAHYILLYC